jgi:hypothetical protein
LQSKTFAISLSHKEKRELLFRTHMEQYVVLYKEDMKPINTLLSNLSRYLISLIRYHVSSWWFRMDDRKYLSWELPNNIQSIAYDDHFSE